MLLKISSVQRLTSFLPLKSSLIYFGKTFDTLPVHQIQNNVTVRLMASQASNSRNLNHFFSNKNVPEQSPNDIKNNNLPILNNSNAYYITSYYPNPNGAQKQISEKEFNESDVQKNDTNNIDIEINDTKTNGTHHVRVERIAPEFKKLLNAYGPSVPTTRPHQPRPKVILQQIPSDYQEPIEDKGSWKRIREYFSKLFEIQSNEDLEGPKQYHVKSSKPRGYFFTYKNDNLEESSTALVPASSKAKYKAYNVGSIAEKESTMEYDGPYNPRIRSNRIEHEKKRNDKPIDNTPRYLRVLEISDDSSKNKRS